MTYELTELEATLSECFEYNGKSLAEWDEENKKIQKE